MNFPFQCLTFSTTTETCSSKYDGDEQHVQQCKICEEDVSRNGSYYIKTYGKYCYIPTKMTWIESKNECLAIKADLPYITLKDQNKEIGDFPGVMLIFDVNLTYYR